MKIETSYVSTPALFQAIDMDTYDDAEDAKPQLVGYGKTEREAINDLVEQIRDDAYADGQRDGQDQAREEAGEKLADAHARIAELTEENQRLHRAACIADEVTDAEIEEQNAQAAREWAAIDKARAERGEPPLDAALTE